MCAKSLQSCPSLCSPMDCSLPDSSVHGILQARVLEWVAILLPGDLLNPGIKPTSFMSPPSACRFLTISTIWEADKTVHTNLNLLDLSQCSWKDWRASQEHHCHQEALKISGHISSSRKLIQTRFCSMRNNGSLNVFLRRNTTGRKKKKKERSTLSSLF